jgi:hypothetical protein
MLVAPPQRTPASLHGSLTAVMALNHCFSCMLTLMAEMCAERRAQCVNSSAPRRGVCAPGSKSYSRTAVVICHAAAVEVVQGEPQRSCLPVIVATLSFEGFFDLRFKLSASCCLHILQGSCGDITDTTQITGMNTAPSWKSHYHEFYMVLQYAMTRQGLIA